MAGSRHGIAQRICEVSGTAQLAKPDWLRQVRDELEGNILPFWMNHAVDKENGGFFGLIDADLTAHRDAARSCVLNTRILWTYSAAARLLDGKYRDMADRAFAYIADKFWDRDYGGLYWMVDYRGNPLSTRKQIYGQAFGIYAFAEYHRASGNRDSLELAKALFGLIEKHSRDFAGGGYTEALGREWRVLEDMRLSDKDLNCPKSMNTHLHVLEAYTNLLRVWREPALEKALVELLTLFMDRIVDASSGHLKLFFNEQWNSLSGHVSFGHDIEAAWLMVEAAETLGDEKLHARAKELSVGIGFAVHEQGLDRDGSVFYEADASGAIVDANKHWWVQAEAVVGLFNAYEISGNRMFLTATQRCWNYIVAKVVDRVHGEWHAKLTAAGVPLTLAEDPDVCLAGPWKCPYHNARACFEMMRRLGSIA